MKTLFYSIILLSVFTFSNCSTTFYDECFDGQNEIRTLDIDQIDELKILGAAEVLLENGTEQSITIEGNKALLDNVEKNSFYSNGRWMIKTKKFCNYNRNDLKVVVTIPNLSLLSVSGDALLLTENPLTNTNKDLEIRVSGSSDVDMNIPDLHQLSIRSSGSISADLVGNAENIDFTITGSGNIRSHDFESKEGEVKITGSGYVEVNSTEKLEIQITGSGTVCYISNPSLNTNITGDGKTKDCN